VNAANDHMRAISVIGHTTRAIVENHRDERENHSKTAAKSTGMPKLTATYPHVIPTAIL
jgi:hypothetical protein